MMIANGSDNSTGPSPLDAYIIPVFYTLIVILGVGGNLLVIFVVIKAKHYRRSTVHVFILHLAFADVFFLVVCLPVHTAVYLLPYWPFGDFCCRAVHFVQYTTMFASVTFLVAMSSDRYLAIARPMRTMRMRTPKNAQFVAVAVWFFSMVLASPWPILFSVRIYTQHPSTRKAITPTPVCSFFVPTPAGKQVLLLFTSIVGYFLPCILISGFSARMLFKLWNFRQPDSNNEALATKKRVTALVSVIVFTFLLCWLPYHCTVMWAMFKPKHYKSQSSTTYYTRVISHALSYANSCMNPIIYNFLSENFRRGFRRVFRRILLRQSSRWTYRQNIVENDYVPVERQRRLRVAAVAKPQPCEGMDAREQAAGVAGMVASSAGPSQEPSPVPAVPAAVGGGNGKKSKKSRLPGCETCATAGSESPEEGLLQSASV